MKRPTTIWLTQVLVLFFGLLLLSGFLINLIVVLTAGGNFSMLRTLIGYGVILSVLLLLAFASWGLAKRKNYGRWLGVLSLLLFWGLIVLMKLRRPSGPYGYYEYDNTAELVGAVIFQVVLHGLFLFLILRLLFAQRVRDFFRTEVKLGLNG